MLPSSDCKKIKIHITTFSNNKNNKSQQKEIDTKDISQMCDQVCKKHQRSKQFVCSICLNEHHLEEIGKVENVRKLDKNRVCSFCQKDSETYHCCTETKVIHNDNRGNTSPPVRKCVDGACRMGGRMCPRVVNSANGVDDVNMMKNSGRNNLRKNNGEGTCTDVRCKCRTEEELSNRNENNTKSGKMIGDEVLIRDKTCSSYKLADLATENNGQSVIGKNVDETNNRTKMCCNHATCEDLSNKSTSTCQKRENNSKDRASKSSTPSKITENTFVDEKINGNKHDKHKHEGMTFVQTQTSEAQMDIGNNGFNLLNEVLSVFQTKKQEPKYCECKLSFNFKDVSTQATVEGAERKLKTLSKSKLVKYSIFDDEGKIRDHSKFVILASHQPETNKPQSLVHLAKHKSSSIPQMKVEELKYAMKEKTKSKDAIDEVNRMFAIVGKFEKESEDDLNRPLVRCGPRILPVVKTKADNPNARELTNNFSEVSGKHQFHDMKSCKFCQTNNYFMSGGDSKCCTNCKCTEEKHCDKCVHMLSCHHNSPSSGLVLCECCQKRNKVCCCKHEDYRMNKERDGSKDF